MTVIGKKLKSNKGVSIIIALLFFMLAFMVTAVVLTSTAANTNRIEKIREEKQAYITTLSVANMIKDILDTTDMKVRVLDVNYEHECKHYVSGDKSTHQPTTDEIDFRFEDAFEGKDAERIFISELYNKDKYTGSQETVFLVKNGVEFGFDKNSERFEIGDADVKFDMIERAIAEMAFQISKQHDPHNYNENPVYKYIGCDMKDVIPDSYTVTIEAEMNKNYDLSFTVGTVIGDTSYYMTIKTRTITTVPYFSRDEFYELHSDSDIQYSIFFDKIETDYDWDVIAYIKGENA